MAIASLAKLDTATSGAKTMPTACYSLQKDPYLTVWGRCVYEADAATGRGSGNATTVCSGHGVSFFGKCFCAPHFDGERCGELARAHEHAACAVRPAADDSCLRHPAYGSAVVPARRWLQAQAAEQRAYRDRHIPRHRAAPTPRRPTPTADRFFAAIPAGSLGRVFELGAGPLTQTWEILHVRPDVTASAAVLEDPGIRGYVANNLTRYFSGPLARVPVTLLPLGAEEVPVEYFGSADTVVMINTIEHAFNGFALLHTAYRLLKPGGLFIFKERIVKMDVGPREFPSMETHPIRLRAELWEWFFMRSGAFSRQRRMLHYADVGRRPRKRF